MDIFFTRLPIFNRAQEVCAYDLRYHCNLNSLHGNPVWEDANNAALTFNILSGQIEKICRRKRAHIAFSKSLLSHEVVSLFPKQSIAVEVMVDTDLSEAHLAFLRDLRENGYRLVFDTAGVTQAKAPWMDLADVLKSDLNGTLALSDHKNSGHAGAQKILAKDVSCQEDFDQAFERGCSYVQGDFYRKPSIGQKSGLRFSKVNHLLLLQEINHPDVSFDRLAGIVKRDVSLSYRLLRYINSAYFGFPNEIHSVKYALALLGVLNIRKWLSRITLQELGDNKPDELALQSIVRARFCESLAQKAGLGGRACELFLTGLFSLLDAFLDEPMAQILSELPISEDIKHALCGLASPFSPIFQLLLCYENGHWQALPSHASALQLRETDLPVDYLKALEWSDHAFVD
jgi:EAL and modified HD-GYP domain-containing signal transduction protein